MTFDVVFLGTGAAVPVPSRAPRLSLDIHGHTFLIDAGRGSAPSATTRGVSEAQGHLHQPHARRPCARAARLVEHHVPARAARTIDIWGPPELDAWLRHTWGSIQAHMSFEVKVHEWSSTKSKPFTKRAIIGCAASPSSTASLAVACVWKNIPAVEIEWPESPEARLPFHVRQALKRGSPLV